MRCGRVSNCVGIDCSFASLTYNNIVTPPSSKQAPSGLPFLVGAPCDGVYAGASSPRCARSRFTASRMKSERVSPCLCADASTSALCSGVKRAFTAISFSAYLSCLPRGTQCNGITKIFETLYE